MYMIYVEDLKANRKFIHKENSPYLLKKFLKKIYHSKRYKLLFYKSV